MPAIKTKCLILTAATFVVSCNISAKEIYPHEGRSEEAPYILQIHGCDLQGMTFGSGIVPINRNSDYSALIVAPSLYREIKYSIHQEIERVAKTHSELRKAESKVSAFEDAGNIPAMDHWSKKATSIKMEIIRGVNKRMYPKIAQTIITRENPSTFYGRSATDSVKANSLQELIDITNDSCVALIK